LHFRLERKQTLIDAYIAKVSKFWDHVLNEIPPPPQDDNDLIHKYFKKNGKYIQATPHMNTLIKELIEHNNEDKVRDKWKKETKFEVKDFIANNDGTTLDNGKKVTLSRVELKAFQEKGLMKTDPELYEEYCTVLDEKRLKADHPEKYAEHCYSKQSTRLILPK